MINAMKTRAPAVARLLGAIGILSFASVSACSVLLKTDEKQCTKDADCRARGGAFTEAVCVANQCTVNDPLGCVTNLKKFPAPTGETLNVTMWFHDVVNPTLAYAGLTVVPCAKLDFTCAKPLASAVTTGDDGSATLGLPDGFDGYLDIQDPKGTKTMPALWYFSPPPTASRTYAVGLLSPQSFTAIAGGVGTVIDGDAGHSFEYALDCTSTYGTYARGVTFEATPAGKSTGFYLINGIPNRGADQTDVAGIGGFANLPPGAVTVKASVAATGAQLGSTSITIRPGTISYSPIAPSLQ